MKTKPKHSKKNKPSLCPYMRIYHAYRANKGLKLSAEEVDLLMKDDAISALVLNIMQENEKRPTP